MNRKHEKEFESLLAALGERSLSNWERQRLWELLEEDEKRVPRYLSILRVNESLAQLNHETLRACGIEVPQDNLIRLEDETPGRALEGVAPEKRVEARGVENSGTHWTKRFSIGAVGIAAGLVAAFTVWQVDLSQLSNGDSAHEGRDDSHGGSGDSDSTPEARYESMLTQDLPMGSLNRPPTPFASTGAEGAENSAEGISFNTHILPILSDNCFACHGPDSKSREADLRLDTPDGPLDAAVLFPGDPENSELVLRLYEEDPEYIMPPPDSHKSLDDDEKALISQWVAEGAKWEDLWSLVPPRRPAIPELERPATWKSNPVDAFVLKKMRQEGLEPNAEADRYALARRASLDLTGLPPSRPQWESFVADSAPGAYGRYIDRLLSSPQAAEHRARFWLDAARYGDTHGLHLDNYREMWPYRDWVIKAFESNMPFDQFVIEQIAGDMLPDPSIEQLIATGFSRCNVTSNEDGSIAAELDARYLVDRVSTVGTVFLGLTMACAACHDHKYDPISQNEFYAMGAFFNNTTLSPLDGNRRDHFPVVALPKKEFEQEWDTLLAERDSLRDQLDSLQKNSETVASWWNDTLDLQTVGAHPVSDEALAVWLPFSPRGPGEPAGMGYALGEGERWAQEHPAGSRGVRFETGAAAPPIESFEFNPSEPLSVSFWVRTPDKISRFTPLLEATQSFEVEIEEEPSVEGSNESDKKGEKTKTLKRGWEIKLSSEGEIKLHIYDHDGEEIDAGSNAVQALAPREWQHVTFRHSGAGANTAIELFVNGEQRICGNGGVDVLKNFSPITADLNIAPRFATGGLSDIRVFQRWLSSEEIAILAQEFDLREWIREGKRWDELDSTQAELATQFFNYRFDKAFKAKAMELAFTQRQYDAYYAKADTTLIMQERRDREPFAWVLERGEYDKLGEKVGPEVPAALSPFPSDAPRNRLGLARWLVDPRNPLTARVTVNRLWQSMFGTGLVKTSEDFGTMGERPTHPDLLDWLAVEFVESGWNVRRVLKLMATSAAYRQSPHVSTEKLERDPENRYLARGGRSRLDAEVIRDQALAVGGLLREDVGGPSVKPYQPDGLWKVVAQRGSNTKEFVQDEGDALYRRSLYTFWKRTAPPPSMAAFDAPTRENCTVRRERTNTPLQALVLLNDVQFVEAARHLATRTLRQGDSADARASWILETALCRPPSDADLQETMAAAKEFQAIFAEDPGAAQKLIETGESALDIELDPVDLAAWTLVANILMNRDDFINES